MNYALIQDGVVENIIWLYEGNADAPKAYLNFEGVDSCFYVFVGVWKDRMSPELMLS